MVPVMLFRIVCAKLTAEETLENRIELRAEGASGFAYSPIRLTMLRPLQCYIRCDAASVAVLYPLRCCVRWWNGCEYCVIAANLSGKQTELTIRFLSPYALLIVYMICSPESSHQGRLFNFY